MEQESDLSRIKELSDVNLRTLEDALRDTLVSQVGGNISLYLTRFARGSGSGDHLEIEFRVIDHDRQSRPVERAARELHTVHC